MLVRRFGVLLRLLVLAKVMMMGGLVMMMGGGVVMSGGLMMMLARRMLRGLCHDVFLPTGPEKSAGCSFDMGGFLFAATLFTGDAKSKTSMMITPVRKPEAAVGLFSGAGAPSPAHRRTCGAWRSRSSHRRRL
jgi:hypothetical protein